MAAEQALALVVRGTDWSETSRITTLFTREFGKVRGLAKGGRRLKSSFDCAFDLLTVCRVVFLRKAHGGLDLLTEAQMTERFPAVRENLPALYAGYYVAELLSDGTQDYDPHPELFDAALDTLRRLGTSPEPPNPPGPPSLGGKGGDAPTDLLTQTSTLPDTREATEIKLPFPSGGGVTTSACGQGERSPELPNPPGPPSLGGKGGDEPTDSLNRPSTLPDVREATAIKHPSPSGGGAGGGVDHVRTSRTFPPSPAPRRVSDLVTRFELVWLKELGYSPRLDVCTGCGKAVPGGVPRVWFSPAAGGVVCTPCSPSQPDRRPLSGDAVRALAALTTGAPVGLDPVRAELRALLGQVVSFVLGRRPRMHRFLDGG